MDRNDQGRQNFALAAIRYDALNNSVRRLAELVNEHTLLLMAIAKHLGLTPTGLIGMLNPEDFINPDDNSLITEPAPEPSIISTESSDEPN